MTSKKPAYIIVHNSLKEAITSGEYPVATLLPTEPELEKLYGVSRTTIRHAIDMLARSKFVEVKQGRGTLVLDHMVNQNVGMISSTTQTLKSKGFAVRPRKIHIDTITATRKLADMLKVSQGSELIRMQRVQLADETPIAIITNYISAKLVPDIERYSNEMESLYALLDQKYNLKVESTHDIISAKNADFTEAELLQIQNGAALITMHRVTFNNNIPLTYDDSKVRADKFQYEINR